MEGPTPVSALIHAATMVTAGVYLLVRAHPIFEAAPDVQHLASILGAITLLAAGVIALVQWDIKRVIAYSTMSQIGYMFLAAGIGAYGYAIFHLMTHAFFKALLFLGAGSVIIALHHEQDMRKMGGLWKYMPWTYATVLVGAIASAGVPGFAGFFSKDAIIEAVHLSKTPGAGFAWLAVTLCVFVTAFYSFRMLFLAFHGKERFGGSDSAHDAHAADAHDAGHDAPRSARGTAQAWPCRHRARRHDGPGQERLNVSPRAARCRRRRARGTRARRARGQASSSADP